METLLTFGTPENVPILDDILVLNSLRPYHANKTHFTCAGLQYCTRETEHLNRIYF